MHMCVRVRVCDCVCACVCVRVGFAVWGNGKAFPTEMTGGRWSRAAPLRQEVTVGPTRRETRAPSSGGAPALPPAGLGEGARWFSRDANTLAWLWVGGAKNTRWTGVSPENREVSTFSPGPGSRPRPALTWGLCQGLCSLETPHTPGPSRGTVSAPERSHLGPLEGGASGSGWAAQPRPSHPRGVGWGDPHQDLDPQGPRPRYLSPGWERSQSEDAHYERS